VNEKGVITKAGVRLSVPEFGDDEMEETYDWIQEIAGSEEVDRELAAAANASLIPGVYGAAGLGRNTGVSLLFTEGVPIENFAYNPKGEFGCRGMTPRPVRQTSKTASFSLTGLALAMQ
jgi:hypothetical protein